MRWTSNGYKNRYRYRLGLKYPVPIALSGSKKLAVNLSNELFFTDSEPYFERNRILAGIEYKLSEFTSIQLGYLHQLDYKINDETGRDFLQLGLSFELKKSKKELE
jgi:long-subunit fatty acid transport protein